MRELNTQEISAVSGASLTTIGSFLGYNFAGLLDSVSSIVGVATNFGSYGSQIGTGIAQLVGLNLGDGQSNICHGVNGMVNTLFTAIGDLFTGNTSA